MENKQQKVRRQVTFNIDCELYDKYKKVMIDKHTTPTTNITTHIKKEVIKFDFENAIDNIANIPTPSTTRLNSEEIEKAYKNLETDIFWDYIQSKGEKVKNLVEKLLNNNI